MLLFLACHGQGRSPGSDPGMDSRARAERGRGREKLLLLHRQGRKVQFALKCAFHESCNWIATRLPSPPRAVGGRREELCALRLLALWSFDGDNKHAHSLSFSSELNAYLVVSAATCGQKWQNLTHDFPPSKSAQILQQFVQVA